MKKIFIVLLSALSLTAVAQQKKVAVYVTGEDAGINKVLGSKLVSAIARSEEYSAIERTESFLAELSKEQNYQRTGAVDDSELTRLGKQFGVQYICVAAVSDAFNEKYLSARIINVETAQVERTASSSGAIQSLEGIVSAANSVSNELLSSLGKDKQSNLKKVAVYVVRNEAGKNIGRVLGDKLVAGFTNSGRYIAIERTNSFLAQLSKEQDYQRSGAVDDSKLSRLGRQFGVQYVCVAEVSEVFGEKYISARLIDAETAEVINTHDVGGKLNDMSGCLKMTNEIAMNLSKGSFKEQVEDELLEKRKKTEELKKSLKEGYVKFGSLYITHSLGYIGWDTNGIVDNIRSNCTIGGWRDWRLPTQTEVAYLRKIFRNYNSNYDDYHGDFQLEFSYIFSSSEYDKFTKIMCECVWHASLGVLGVDSDACSPYGCKGYNYIILVRGHM